MKNTWFNRILLPIDGSETAKKAAKVAINLAEKTDIPIKCIEVVTPPIPMYPEFEMNYPEVRDIHMKKAREDLEEIERLGKAKNMKIETEVLEGPADDLIIKSSKKNDVIIMGSKGKSAVGRILIGSVSEKILHHADVSVMIVR